jgi:hypothetical protein
VAPHLKSKLLGHQNAAKNSNTTMARLSWNALLKELPLVNVVPWTLALVASRISLNPAVDLTLRDVVARKTPFTIEHREQLSGGFGVILETEGIYIACKPRGASFPAGFQKEAGAGLSRAVGRRLVLRRCTLGLPRAYT